MNPMSSQRYEAVRARFLARLDPGLMLVEACLAQGAAGDWAGLGAFAHKLAGTAGSFGFARLGDVALELEMALQGAMPDEVTRAAQTLRAALVQVAGQV